MLFRGGGVGRVNGMGGEGGEKTMLGKGVFEGLPGECLGVAGSCLKGRERHGVGGGSAVLRESWEVGIVQGGQFGAITQG